MEKILGYYIFGGLLIGALLGQLWSANGSVLTGLGIGAFAGAAIGWFAGAAVLENQKQKKEKK